MENCLNLMKHTVFISYSHKDAKLVDRLDYELRLLGLTVWRDVIDINVSDQIPAALQKAINQSSDIFLVALTDNALASPWVEWEQHRANEAAASGWPIGIVYVKLDPKTKVPEEIRDKRFVDLSSRSQVKYYKELVALAKYCLSRQPFSRLGIYDIYTTYADLDARREDTHGNTGCTIDDFVNCAQRSVVGVGYWFSNLFGPDSGRGVSNLLSHNERVQVELYLPDPQTAPLQHLARIHETQGGVVERIDSFIDYFKSWGETRGLSANQAARCTLHLLRIVPTNSFLCVDPEDPAGRMIVQCYAVGIAPSQEMKIELRYPQTHLYRTYLESLKVLRQTQNVSRSLTTSYVH